MRKSTARTLLVVSVAIATSQARADICSTLQQQYLAAGNGAGATTVRAANDVSRLTASLQVAQNSAQLNHCYGSPYGQPPAPFCGLITQEVGRLQSQIRAARLVAPRSTTDQARDALIANGCPVPQAAPPPAMAAGSYDTLCVRLCDGFYFPLEQGVSSSRFQASSQLCEAAYGNATAAKLYVMQAGGDVAAATPVNSRKPYGTEPYAFAYRKSYDSACAGQLQSGLSTLTAQLTPTAATAAKPPALPWPIPQLRPMKFEDPETIANAAGRFAPKVAEIAPAAEASNGVRIVGKAYYSAAAE
jgi:hypothetical protein